MKDKNKLVRLLCLVVASASGCGVPLDDESTEEAVTAEQAVTICKQTAACGEKEPVQAVREISRQLGRDVFKDREDVDEEKAGTVMLKLLSGFEPQGYYAVSKEERRLICEATRGRFADKVIVTRCMNGEQGVLPIGSGFNDTEPQPQRCTEGTGHEYSNQCVYVDLNGDYYFDDGPSMKPWQEALTPGRLTNEEHRYVVLFWEAGQRHDYCYHHTPTYGFRRELCDDDFDNKMHQICENQHRGLFDIPGTSLNRGSCKLAAKAMAAAVRYHPEAATAFRNMKTFVRYMEPRALPKPEFPESTASPVEVNSCVAPSRKLDDGSCACDPGLREACVTSTDGLGRYKQWVPSGDENCGACETDS